MKNKLTLLLIFLGMNGSLLVAQDTIKLKENKPQTAFYMCKWGAKNYMELASNKLVYIFKSSLPDGQYVAYFNKCLCKDSAMLVVIYKGEIDGVLKRWDKEDKKLAEECEYTNGVMNGYRKLYFYTPDGQRLTNIERWENGVHQEDILITW
jgi:hypothetical protein